MKTIQDDMIVSERRADVELCFKSSSSLKSMYISANSKI